MYGVHFTGGNNKNILRNYGIKDDMRVVYTGTSLECMFKVYTRTTPLQYIVSIRIANAQVLLVTTTYTVTEIGRIAGYENPLYFNHIFHKQKGISPSEYRKRIVKGKTFT